MNTFYAVLEKTINRAGSVVSFRFKPETSVDFQPGQFLKLIFDQENLQNKELNKYLSFSCSPTKDYFEVTKKLSSSAFSNSLCEMKPGDRIMFQGPMGKCVFKQEYQKIGFLVGGIGITPVISILEYIVDKNLDTDVTLLYSNRNDKQIAFRKELDLWNSKGRNIDIVYTVTDCKPEDGVCIEGQISKDLLNQKVENMGQRVFFIFGPPVMVEAMKKICIESGCNEELIREENFLGY